MNLQNSSAIQGKRTNIWAAVHLLEKMPVDGVAERKALAIIEQEARESNGMEYWLKAYKKKRSSGV